MTEPSATAWIRNWAKAVILHDQHVLLIRNLWEGKELHRPHPRRWRTARYTRPVAAG